jgi:hypothetical protein
MVNLFQILNQFVFLFRKNVIEKSSMIWRVLPLVKINTRISETPCVCIFSYIPLSRLYVQDDFESCADILITSYWLHVELGKNILKILCQKIK